MVYSMPMKKRLQLCMLMLCLMVSDSYAVNTFSMSRELLNIKCLNYCLEGACVFLKCGLTGCSINTVPKVSHNRPDLLVSAVSQPGDEPWTEARLTIVNIANRIGGSLLERMFGFFMGGGEDSATTQKANTQNLKFKDVHILGTPMASMNFDHMCKSHTDAFTPHLVTESNFIGWRLGIERILPQSYVPGYDEVGQFPSHTWGPVYPRNGVVNQRDDAKAAAVMARRGMSVITDGGMGHIYQSFPGGNQNNTPWQPLHPRRGQCEAQLGTDNSLSWSEKNLSEDGNNSWLYWQRYQCCLGGKGIKIAEIRVGPICL